MIIILHIIKLGFCWGKQNMKKKIIVIFAIMLLMISTAFSVACDKKDSYKYQNVCRDIVDLQTKTSKSVFKQVNNGSNEYSTYSYLIQTEWGQHGYYKSKCPWTKSRPPEQCRLGCWSVAIGQIINYHHNYYDLQSQGIVDYWCTENWIDPQHIVNNLDEHDYDWSQMVNKLVGTSSDAEKDNVSRLLFDTATVIQKDFGTGGYLTVSDTSDLTVLINELINHFEDITPLVEWDNDLTESEIVYEIDHGRPIMFYSIAHNLTTADTFGHAWIIDGYRYNDSGGRLKFEVHFNYGWAGENPDSLDNSWYYYYGVFPTFDENMVFDETGYRKGLLIRLAPKPPGIMGPSTGVVGVDYNYTASTIYDINPPLYYKFDWGDGTYTDWQGRYDSGEPCVMSHAWTEKGVYEVSVKAKDVDGWESDWSEPLSVSMPRNKVINTMPFFLRFLQPYPAMYQILQRFIKLCGV